MKNLFVFFVVLSISFISCFTTNGQGKSAITDKDKYIVSPNAWVEMTQKIALWSGIVTYLLDTDETSARKYEDDFINGYFKEVIADDFEGWTVKSPYGDKNWPNKAAFLDSDKGYVTYNKKFGNNIEHTITTPVITPIAENKALMYVNILNRTVDRLESDNSVPMWKTNIYWQKKSGKWCITKGVAFYENP